MSYNFSQIESKWQKYWAEKKIYRVTEDPERKKFYVLNMFPYPSGAGLHVGHPLGYIASDIYARYMRLNGYNVLNPMGYDAYGLPAEQYAIQTGQHPAITTVNNIKRYREQLDKIGFSFDWSREIQTCSPDYYHWTQWAFIQMFESYFDTTQGKAMPISHLIETIEREGTAAVTAAQTEAQDIKPEKWQKMSEAEKQEVLLNYRLAYLGETMVNWCEELGTVLANDEVVDGVSVRGGYPVVQKKMRQWCLRVSAYAQRLLESLDSLEWSDALKETQRNWIGKSEGAEMIFEIKDSPVKLQIFTTRADTIFGVTFMVLAPENKEVLNITTPDRLREVKEYIAKTQKRTERERMTDRQTTGVFTGAYAIHPMTGRPIPIWVSDYVLAGYGTGAIMAVPAHDSRDYAFAKKFDLPIIPLIQGADVSEESFDAKEGIMTNSPVEGEKVKNGFTLNGLEVKDAIAATKKYITEKGIGRVKVNYRLRDAIFSRQRYWGEPFPVYYKNGLPYMIPVECLPLRLPDISEYKPTDSGEPPLARAEKWGWDEQNKTLTDKNKIDDEKVFPIEVNTMPGFAGSSAYFIRYMDPHNAEALADENKNRYWQNVDLYVGGTEHATGHLIYSRYWNKFLFDIGAVCCEEPFNKLVNQGMIQGRSNFVYRVNDAGASDGHPVFVSLGLKDRYADTTPIHVDVNIVHGDVLDVEAFKQWRPEYADAEMITEDGKYICGWAVEKMSKSMYNVVNPDMIIEKYGADTLRLYEMFLGPVQMSKPWDTNGIDGCHRFLKKLWALYHNTGGEEYTVKDVKATEAQLRTLHKLIKKITSDIQNFSYNTAVSAFMIAVNEWTQSRCEADEILRPLIILLAPFAPHVAEELWAEAGNDTTVCDAQWPTCDERYLVESEVTMAVSFNGKARFEKTFKADADVKSIETEVLADERTLKYIDGKNIIKVIIVPKKIINIVIK